MASAAASITLTGSMVQWSVCEEPELQLPAWAKEFNNYATIPLAGGEKAMNATGYVQSKLPPGRVAVNMSDLLQKEFQQLTDFDGDGGLNVSDYAVIETLVNIPQRDLLLAFRMFDVSETGVLSAKELEGMIQTLTSNTLGDMDLHQIQRDNTCGHKLLQKMISTPPEDQVTYNEFSDFVMRLRRWVLTAMFEQYDKDDTGVADGVVGARSFAELMIIRFAPDDMKPKLRERLQSLPKSPDHLPKISISDCVEFGKVIRNVDTLERFCSDYMNKESLTRNELQSVCSAMLGVTIPELALNIIFHLLDHDGSGDLSKQEFFQALDNDPFAKMPPQKKKSEPVLECLKKCV